MFERLSGPSSVQLKSRQRKSLTTVTVGPSCMSRLGNRESESEVASSQEVMTAPSELSADSTAPTSP